jgi:hypothetical protein
MMAGARAGASAGAGMQHPDPVEPRDRRGDGVGAVIDVVDDAYRMNAGKPQDFAADLGISKETLGRMGAPRRQM